MKIGIDLDETLCGFLPTFLDFYNDKYKTHFQIEDFFSYGFWRVLNISKEQAIIEVQEHFAQSPFFSRVPVLDGAKEAIDTLAKNHELFIVTSRPKSLEKEALLWIDQYFPNTFKEVLFSNHESFDYGKIPTKEEYCQKLHLEAFVEDSLEYALQCSTDNRFVFLLDSPWNQREALPENVFRVSSWKEIVLQIESKKH